MRKLVLALLSASLIAPPAWAGPGDDALTAFSFGDYSRALKLAKPAAQSDDFMAKFVLARIFVEGKAVPQDKVEADKWFKQTLSLAKPAAESGEPRAQFVLGRMHHGGWILPKDMAQAVAWYRKSAEQGYEWAQINLGLCYASGEGLAKDETEAVAWYRKAAEQGNANGQIGLGVMYASGRGVSKDEKEAVAWYRKAAEQNNSNAQTNLGIMYESGLGVSIDAGEAVSWYRKAADQGNASGQDALGRMYASGSGISKDETEAVAWYRKAAEQNNAHAQNQLGIMYESGLGVSKDAKEAAAWYRKAAEQGEAAAQSALGWMYVVGEGVARDDALAVQWFLKSVKQGHDRGQLGIAAMYEFGRGVPKSKSDAIDWYRKAADQGNAAAKNKLRELEGPPAVQPGVAVAAGASKEEIRDMIQAAMKTNSQNQAPAAPKALASDVDTPAYAAPENADNFAVVIGVEKYATLPSAEFAERDAEAVRAHLQAMGYPARNIYFLTGQQATRAKIAQSVNTWLPGRVTPTSTVFFYYSGHGAPDPQTNQAYLVPMDGDPEDLDSTAYPIKLLYSKLGKLKTKQVIVALDSCFSGAGGRSVLAKGTRPLVGKIDMGGLPDNMVALTASDKSQISGTLDDQGHGAFTYYMLKGLAGGAKNAGGHVTMQSLYDYLTPKVQDAARLSNRSQTPQLLNGKQAGATLR